MRERGQGSHRDLIWHWELKLEDVLDSLQDVHLCLYEFSTSTQKMPVSGWATITKYPKLGGLHRRHLFLLVLEAGKSELRVPAQSGSGKGPLCGSQMTAFSLHSQVAERGGPSVSSPFYKSTNPILRSPHSRSHWNLISNPKIHLLMLSHWWYVFNLWIWREAQAFSP